MHSSGDIIAKDNLSRNWQDQILGVFSVPLNHKLAHEIASSTFTFQIAE